MTTVTAINGNPVSITKGAPEVILNKCLDIDKKQLEDIVSAYAKDGLRVMAVAIKQLTEIPANPNTEELENELTFIGIIGIEDNISSKAAKVCKEALSLGIKTIMVTGDHIDTAIAISQKAGIISSAEEAINGEELAKIDDEQLVECISKYSVFARISPQDKLRIVNALKANGEKVLITGDSVNDSVALNEADFGCALGTTASDLVKDSADMIVENNHYSSIIYAIRESSKVVSNVKKALLHLLTVSISFVLITMFGLMFFGIQPLSAPALIVAGIILIAIPLIAIFFDKSLCDNKQKKANKLFNKAFLTNVAISALIITILSLLTVGVSSVKDGAVFVVLFLGLTSQAINVLLNNSILSLSFLKQKFSILICFATIILLLAVILSPVSTLISFTALSSIGWLFGIITFVSVLLVNEIVKFKM